MNININQTPDELPVALKTFKFPKALKVTSQGLEPVNRPGVKLKDPISKEDVEKESSISDSSEAYYTKWEKQAYKMLSRSVTASAKISIPWLFAAFDLGASYKNALKSFSQGEETELFMVAQRLVKGAKVILKLENIELTDNFLKSVDKVLKSVDKVDKSNGIADLRKVFQEYGYFVATTYILGGKIVAEETKIFSGKQDKTALADEFKSFVTADWDKGSVAVENNNQNRTSQSSAQTTAKYSMKIQGGKEGLFNNTTEWINSITSDNWQIVEYEDLKPITDFLDDERKKKCEEILSSSTSINKLPRTVAENIKGMALHAAWHTANKCAGETYQKDAEKDEVKFKDYSRKVSQAVNAVSAADYHALTLTQNSLDNIKWGAWNAAWYAANIRRGYQNDANKDEERIKSHFKSLEDSKEVTKELAENIKNMCKFAAWYAANTRKGDEQDSEHKDYEQDAKRREGYKQDAAKDFKEFEDYYNQIVEDSSSQYNQVKAVIE